MFSNNTSTIKTALTSQLSPEKLAAATGLPFDKLENMLASFASAFNQNDRLFKLQIGDGSQFGEVFLPQRVEGIESLSANYRYHVTCLSPHAFLPLAEMVGYSAQIDIITGTDGGFDLDLDSAQDVTRCGLITQAQSLPSDGGFAKYRFTIESPLALLRHRRTSRVFQDISVPDIVEQILREHINTNSAIAGILDLKFELYRQYAERSYCLQYRESDLAFIERLLFEEGLPYRFAHQAGEAPSVTFIVFDDPYGLPQSTQGAVRFHRVEATEAEDSLTQWTELRQIGPVAASLTSYDYKPVFIHSVSEATHTDQGNDGIAAESSLEDFDAQTLYYGKDGGDLDRYALRRQEAHDWEKGGYTAEGNLRQLTAAQWFVLNDHPYFDRFPDQESREFVACALSFCANNNLPSDLLQYVSADNAEPSEQPPYWVSLSARKRGLPLTPGFGHTTHAKPTAPGTQTATVVGPPGEEVYTDHMGRVKIQFHWQRPKEHPDYGAAWDERSSCWVRVAYPSAGATWGSQFIPRIGQEVLIDFLEGDIDRPVVDGVIHNGAQPNPYFSGTGQLPANRTLSGIKTKEHFGSQYGELLFDDTQDEVRTKLSSEHGKTQLNQGYLIHPRTDGEGEPRGDGVELRTDRHAALRAAEGILLTTEAKPGASGKQLDREQALALFQAAQQTAKTLGDVAEHQVADAIEIGPETRDEEGQKEGKAAHGHLDHLVKAVLSWEAGTNTDPKGETATDDPSGRQPVLILSGAEGVGLTTPKEIVLAAEKNLDTISQRDTQQTSVRRWIHNAGSKISLFVHGVADKVNLKLITAKGNAQLQAQDGDIEIVGDQSLFIDACKEKLIVSAEQELLLTCAGGYIRLSGGNIDIHCPGGTSFKAANFDLNGPASMEAVKKSFGKPKLCPGHALDAKQGGGGGGPVGRGG